MNWSRTFVVAGYVACAALFVATGAALARPEWFTREKDETPVPSSVAADAPVPKGIEHFEDTVPAATPTPAGLVVEDGRVLAQPPTLRTKYPHLFPPTPPPSKALQARVTERREPGEPDVDISVSVEFAPGVNTGRGCSVRVPGSPCAERERTGGKGGIPFPVSDTVTMPTPPTSAGEVTPTTSLPQTESTVVKPQANVPFPVSSAPTPTPAPCDTD